MFVEIAGLRRRGVSPGVLSHVCCAEHREIESRFQSPADKDRKAEAD